LRAELAAVRARGWAMVDQELEEGLRSVAAPIRDQSGQVVAAINVATNVSRTGADELVGRIVPQLLATASLIEHDLARSTIAQPPAASRQPVPRP
jgi:IclR family pca regulon transcriptional regulator